MAGISRRQLLRRLAALACGAVGADLLAACAPAAQPTPTAPPTVAPATAVLPPTDTPAPLPTSTPVLAPILPRPEVIKFYPAGTSTVVRTRHAAVWDGENLVPEAVRQMLDASITALTGLSDARAAWATLFRPNERIAIKVNAFRNSLVWTHVPLVTAVTDSLQEAGIPAEQIVLFDHQSDELITAGFRVNKEGPGVLCYGSDLHHTDGWSAGGAAIKLSNVLLGCDALINMPILKTHGMSGISYALKNHYGTISQPESLHGSQLTRGMAELNALPAIRDRTRLIVGDALAVCLKGSDAWPYWREAKPHDTIFVSYDPVAVDTLGLQLFSQMLVEEGGNPVLAQAIAGKWLDAAAELGVGTNDEANIKLLELALP